MSLIARYRTVVATLAAEYRTGVATLAAEYRTATVALSAVVTVYASGGGGSCDGQTLDFSCEENSGWLGAI